MTLSSFLNRVRGGVETKMSAGEGASSGRPHTPRIKVENQNAKQCHNWIRTCAGEKTTKMETIMGAGKGPSGGGANPMSETRVVYWILSGSDEGPSNDKEERAGEGASKWVRHLPHIFEHKCLATTQRVEGATKV
jgi:hypothetical protein